MAPQIDEPQRDLACLLETAGSAPLGAPGMPID